MNYDVTLTKALGRVAQKQLFNVDVLNKSELK